MAQRPDPYAEILTGTTILAFVYQDGVFVAADCRTSMGGYYVANRSADKIDYLSSHIVALRTGTSSVTQNQVKEGAYELEVHSTELGRLPSVRTAARIMHNISYNEQKEGAFLIAGWDPYRGPQVFNVLLGGALIEGQKVVFSGSGSSYIFGFIDSNFRQGMTFEEAKEFSLRALGLAMFRDRSSGGSVRLMTIDQHGMHRTYVPFNEVPYN